MSSCRIKDRQEWKLARLRARLEKSCRSPRGQDLEFGGDCSQVNAPERRTEKFRRVASYEVLHSSRERERASELGAPDRGAEVGRRQGSDRRQAIPPRSSREPRSPRLTFLPPGRLRTGHSFPQEARPLAIEAYSVRFPTLRLLGAPERSGSSGVRSHRCIRRRTRHLFGKRRR